MGMRIDVLSKEYPPEIYGGAGVHVAELVRALRARDDVDARVHAFGAPRDEPGTTSYADLAELAVGQRRDPHARRRPGDGRRLRRRGRRALAHLVRQHGRPPRVAAARRPARGDARTAWSRCGRGRPSSSAAATRCRAGSSARRTTPPPGVIAVSGAMRDDVLRSYPDVDPDKVHVVHNGIDTDLWSPTSNPDRVRELGVDPDRPSVIFVGRITRQKGLPLFLQAAAQLPPDVQLVLCAGAPDTQEIEAEVRGLVDGLAADAQRRGVDRRDAPPRRRRRAAHRRDRVRLPLDLRAARHREPRGDGLRDRGGRHRDRRHPRGRRRRRDRLAGADRAGHRRHRHPAAPRAVRRRPRRRADRRGQRPGPRRVRTARPGGAAPRSPSAGRRSPSRRWASTARFAADRFAG